MKQEINYENVLKMFGEGFDCSQVVLSYLSGKLEITQEEALKIAANFGGGMCHGETCGCVIASLIALGIKYGTVIPGDKEGKDKLLQKKAEFEEKFCEKFSSCTCKKILGYDLSNPEEMTKIQEEKLLETKCPEIVCETCKILEEML